jgi:Zn-dependent protease
MFIFWIVALVIALSIHEYAHARAADELGDPTPRLNGRLTLNPLAHLDPIGTLMLLLFRFGWGKPVPIDPYNLRNPRRDQALISLAGPASNFITAIAFALAYHLLSNFVPTISSPLLFSFAITVVIMNLGLGIFNLLPFGPLDGAKIFLGFLPADKAEDWEQAMSQYSLSVFLLMLLPIINGSSILSLTLGTLVNFFLKLLFPSFSGIV